MPHSCPCCDNLALSSELSSRKTCGGSADSGPTGVDGTGRRANQGCKGPAISSRCKPRGLQNSRRRGAVAPSPAPETLPPAPGASQHTPQVWHRAGVCLAYTARRARLGGRKVSSRGPAQTGRLMCSKRTSGVSMVKADLREMTQITWKCSARAPRVSAQTGDSTCLLHGIGILHHSDVQKGTVRGPCLLQPPGTSAQSEPC